MARPQGNIELMPKKQVLDFKPAPRLEKVGDGTFRADGGWQASRWMML
jgi:hypothetical protein